MADDDQKPEENNEDAPESEDEDAEGAEGEEGESPKKAGNKMLIIVVAAAVVLGLLIGASVFLFLGGSKGEDTADLPPDPSTILAAVAFVEMPVISANFMTNSGLGRQVRLKVKLEVSDESQVPLVEQMMPRIVDDFQTHLRQLRFSDTQGSAGTLRLKNGLLRRAQQSAAPANIQNVLFEEIQIQ